ncbi:phage terminase large subunit family protein [Azospirillum canadense]|uniref:phage terminase large subunit family protein n=1 Tax=Azospirillum canadense TaxID=403962 RepID=UPI0022269754|nr:phage terminase large subunit family protein [Azospirillum canadense]MCW2242244.1 phage terminase large subunit GpA-like protein [Azospirillum canadense]
MSQMSPGAAELLGRWASLLRPPPKRFTDEWAAESVEMPPTSGIPGPYDASRTPYVIPIMRAFDNPRWKMIVVVMGSQMGKTLAFAIIIGRRMDDDPVPIMYVGPDRNFVEDTFEPQFISLVKSCKSLFRKTIWGKAHKKVRKIINGAVLRLAWAGSASQLAGQPAGMVLVDERDRMGDDVKDEGDPVTLGGARLHSYANGKVGVISTPLVGNVDTYVHPDTGLEHWKYSDPDDLTSPTWKLWQEGTRFEWAWPCPHCGEYFIPRLSRLTWNKPEGRKVTPAEAARSARMTCPNPACDSNTHGLVIDDSHKVWMNERAVFVAPGQRVEKDGTVVGELPDTDIASFWVSGLASNFVSWGDRAKEFVKAARSKNKKAIQATINTGFGELYRLSGDAPKHDVVLACRLPYASGEVPYGVQKLSLTVDVQKDRLYYVVRGWGARWESWLIKADALFGETDQDHVWNDLADVLQAEYQGFTISLCLIDYGYRPGDKEKRPTHAVADFCRRFGFHRARPIQGKAELPRPIMTFKLDVDTKGKTRTYGVTGHHLDTDVFKTWVHGRLEWPADQPGGWHLPEDIDEDYARQIVSESRMALPSGKGKWVKHGENHYLDAEMMQRAAAELMGVATMQPLPEQTPMAADEEEEAPRVRLANPPPKTAEAATVRQNSWLGNARKDWLRR